MRKIRLSYRPLQETDVSALISLWGDYEVIKYTGIKKSANATGNSSANTITVGL